MSDRNNPDRKPEPHGGRPHRLGRPRKSPDELRTAEVRCRLTPAEKLKLTEDARACGLSAAEYVRRLVLGHKPCGRGECDPRLLYELNAVGNNLNQAVRDVHAGRQRHHDWDELRNDLRRLLDKVALGDGVG